jgi:hypothetical protein
MSYSNPSSPSPDSITEEQPFFHAELVQSGEGKDDYSRTTSSLLHLPRQENLAYSEEEIQTTDTIDFNFLSSSASCSTQPETAGRSLLAMGKGLLTPWGISGLFCFLLANLLLTVSQFSSLQATSSPATTIATAVPTASVPTANPSLRLDGAYPSPLSINQLSELPSPTVANPSTQPTTNLTAHQAIASLETVPSLPPTSVNSAPANESLAALLLPPSLQPQISYSTALLPSPPRPQLPPRSPVAGQFKIAPPLPSQAVPANHLPTVAVRPSHLPAISPVPLPPPPPISSQIPPSLATLSNPTAVAPVNSTNTINGVANPPAPINNPVSSGVNSSLPAPTSTASSPASEQILRQILNQQNQGLGEENPTAQESFNQKTRKKLQTLYNQNQGVVANPKNPETQGLVNQLQQLNQPE